MITHKQLSLADIFTDCQNKFENDKYQFLQLLEDTINLDEIVPASFEPNRRPAAIACRSSRLFERLPLAKVVFFVYAHLASV